MRKRESAIRVYETGGSSRFVSPRPSPHTIGSISLRLNDTKHAPVPRVKVRNVAALDMRSQLWTEIA
jgi:hypothetical protein